MDDLGLNTWLKDTYGTTTDNKPLFRLIWSTGVTEYRRSTFRDYYGDIFIREVTEVREVLKYPFAQDRWVLERIRLVSDKAKEAGLVTINPYSYEDIYTFQDKKGEYLPLDKEMLEAAMYLFFKFYLQMTPTEKIDLKMQLAAQRQREKRNIIREALGDGPAPHSLVLSRIAGIDRSKK